MPQDILSGLLDLKHLSIEDEDEWRQTHSKELLLKKNVRPVARKLSVAKKIWNSSYRVIITVLASI